MPRGSARTEGGRPFALRDALPQLLERVLPIAAVLARPLRRMRDRGSGVRRRLSSDSRRSGRNALSGPGRDSISCRGSFSLAGIAASAMTAIGRRHAASPMPRARRRGRSLRRRRPETARGRQAIPRASREGRRRPEPGDACRSCRPLDPRPVRSLALEARSGGVAENHGRRVLEKIFR